jgi:hypothetical protein
MGRRIGSVDISPVDRSIRVRTVDAVDLRATASCGFGFADVVPARRPTSRLATDVGQPQIADRRGLGSPNSQLRSTPFASSSVWCCGGLAVGVLWGAVSQLPRFVRTPCAAARA